jgi:hypothetical protein
MPTGAFHTLYWQTQAPEAPITGVSAKGGYPAVWQPIIVTTMTLIFLVIPGV